MSEHSCFRNNFSRCPDAALKFLRGLSLEMWSEVPKVPLGIAPPLVTCACFEIKCPNMPGVRVSVFYSTSIASDDSPIINQCMTSQKECPTTVCIWGCATSGILSSLVICYNTTYIHTGDTLIYIIGRIQVLYIPSLLLKLHIMEGLRVQG